MKLRRFLTVPLMLSLLLMSGCWDSVELNDRAFVLGIGLDKGDSKNNMKITYEIALPDKIVGGVGGGGGESGGGKTGGGSSTWDITKVAPFMMPATETIHENIDKVVDMEHMQVLVLGSEFSKEGIFDKMDYFFRRPQMRRRTKVVYAEGNAQDILKVEPKTAKSPSVFINKILNMNPRYVNTISRPTDLGEIVQNIRYNYDFTIPRIEVIDNNLSIDGQAIFKNGKFVGTIEEGEVPTIDLVRGKVDRGSIEIPDPSNPNYTIVFEVYGGSGKLKPVFNGDKVDFKLNLKIEGDLAIMENLNFNNTLDTDYLDAVQKNVGQKVRERIMMSFNKYIKGQKVDIFELQKKIHNYNIRFFDKHKSNIDEILANSNLETNIDAKVRRVGLVK